MSETEINKNNQSEGSSNNNSMCLVIVVVIVLIGAIVLHFSGVLYKEIKTIAASTPSTTYDNPIPYVFPTNYKKSLLDYIYNATHTQILLLLGSSGSGKSRSLIEISNTITSNSTFMLTLDFNSVGKSISKNDLMFSIRRNIMHSIAKIDGKKGFKVQSALSLLQRYVQALESSMNKKSKKLQKVKMQHKKLQNALLLNITEKYLEISDEIVSSPELAFRILLEASEAISPFMQPVIVLICPENLFDCYNQRISHLLSAFFKTTKKFYDEYHSLPIIIEVSDQSVFLESFNNTIKLQSNDEYNLNISNKKFPFDHDRFKLLYNDGFNQKEAEKVLTDNNKIFSKSELALIYEVFGGHGESIAMAHELAREGFTVGEIINTQKEQSKGLIVKTIKMSSNETRATNYIRKLVGKKELPISFDSQMSHYFLANRIVTIVNETKVKLSNKKLYFAASEVTSIISKKT